MKLVTFHDQGAWRPGCLVDGRLRDASPVVGSDATVLTIIQTWERIGPELRAALSQGILPDRGPLEDHRLGPPLPRPGKVICIGLNYADHAAETGASIPDIPVVFNKFPSCIIGPGEAIRLPAISQQVDFEAELVVVIGTSGRQIDPAHARRHVFGYCCGHDVSARDWQKGRPGGQWLLGKAFDTFAPIGPWIATADEIPDPHDLRIRFRLNGRELQDSSTRQFIFSIDQLIAHLSKFVTLEPGDLLFTGTPPGVGVARTPPVFLQPGDWAEVEIEGLGVLGNPVVAD